MQYSKALLLLNLQLTFHPDTESAETSDHSEIPDFLRFPGDWSS